MESSPVKCGLVRSSGQSRRGHSSIKTTLDTNGHLLAGIDEAAAAALRIHIAPSTRPEVVTMAQDVNEIAGS